MPIAVWHFPLLLDAALLIFSRRLSIQYLPSATEPLAIFILCKITQLKEKLSMSLCGFRFVGVGCIVLFAFEHKRGSNSNF